MQQALDELREFIATRAPATQYSYRTILKQWLEHLGREDINDYSMADCTRFLRRIQSRRGYAPPPGAQSCSPAQSTIATKIIALKSFYSVLMQSGHVTVNHFASPMFSEARRMCGRKYPRAAIAARDVRRMCDGPSLFTREGRRDRAIMAVLFGGALRRAEVTKLNLGDVRRHGRDTLLFLRETKNKRDYLQPLPLWAGREVLRVLKDRRGASLSDPLLAEHTGARLTPDKVGRIFKAYAIALGLGSHVSTHWARHTAITRLATRPQEVPARLVQLFARHSSIVTTERYIHEADPVGNNPGRLLTYNG